MDRNVVRSFEKEAAAFELGNNLFELVPQESSIELSTSRRQAIPWTNF